MKLKDDTGEGDEPLCKIHKIKKTLVRDGYLCSACWYEKRIQEVEDDRNRLN